MRVCLRNLWTSIAGRARKRPAYLVVGNEKNSVNWTEPTALSGPFGCGWHWPRRKVPSVKSSLETYKSFEVDAIYAIQIKLSAKLI